MDKKQPIRMCAVCRLHKDKKDLIKIVKVKDGEVFIEKDKRINGRSVYLCKNKDCIEKAKKSKLLERNLGAEQSIYKEIYEQ